MADYWAGSEERSAPVKIKFDLRLGCSRFACGSEAPCKFYNSHMSTTETTQANNRNYIILSEFWLQIADVFEIK